MNTYPRETVEFQEVTVKVDGEAITDYEVTVLPWDARPTSGWATPTTLDGKHGVLLTGLTSNTYRIWARISDNPETPVIGCGLIEVT